MSQDLLDQVELVKIDITPYLAATSSAYQALWRLQISLFNTNPTTFGNLHPGTSEQELLEILYARPVNSLGQVPNLGHDVGGSAVTCESKYGPFTICLELPHASPEDQDRILKNPRVATHFNPVFVAAELIAEPSRYEIAELPLWIMAKKQFQGRSVLYHETVLYELLGNNLLANAMFPAVPRLLFNPRKNFLDTSQHDVN